MKLPTIGQLSRSKLSHNFIALVLLVCVVAGCKQMQSLSGPKVLKSPDGKFQLTVPGGWQDKPSLNAKASIGAANPLDEMYVIVITESKADFTAEMTLDEFTNVTRNSITSNLLTPEATQPQPVSVNGNSARAYEVDGVIKSVKLAYRIATVETPEHYHQIITWTLMSRKDSNRGALQQVIDSFRPAADQGK
jgi:hypothetical protein